MKKETQRQKQGFALMAVIWVVGFLTMILTVTLLFVKKEAESIISSEHSFRAWQLAHTGLSFGSHADVKRGDEVLNFKPTHVDEGYEVQILSEDARINLNHVIYSEDKALLRNLFRLWLDDEDEVNALTDAMIDWVDSNDLVSLNGAEKDWYQSKGFENRPFNREFLTLDEVRLVKGFSEIESRVPDWRNWFTLQTRGPIDIHEAEPRILSVAAETDILYAEEFSVNVRGDDQILGTEDDRRYSNLAEALDALKSSSLNDNAIVGRFTLQGSTTRVESVGRSGVYSTKISTVIRRQGRAPSILSYEETNLTSE